MLGSNLTDKEVAETVERNIPKDAGNYKDDLRDILSRIPRGWGWWISCNKGWYPLLAETNDRLRALDPNYEVHQVKEKFGTLRYYAELSPQPLEECQPPCTKHCEKMQAELDSDDGPLCFKSEIDGRDEARAKLQQQFWDVIADAEAQSADTCEHCGKEDHLKYTGQPYPWDEVSRKYRNEDTGAIPAELHEDFEKELAGKKAIYEKDQAEWLAQRDVITAGINGGYWVRTLCKNCRQDAEKKDVRRHDIQSKLNDLPREAQQVILGMLGIYAFDEAEVALSLAIEAQKEKKRKKQSH